MSTMSLEAAFQLIGRPELVKQAEGLRFESRDATLRSFVSTLVKNASDQRAMTECWDHAKFWGITAECDAAQKKIASFKPAELKDSDFVLTADHNGNKVQKFAAYDAPSTVRAASAFYENRHSYPYEWRTLAASRILAKVGEFDANLPEYIESYLDKAMGAGVPTADSLREAYVQRANLMPKHAAAQEDLTKLGALVEAMADNPQARYDLELVGDVVNALEACDAKHGLTAKYGSALELPEEVIDTDGTASQLTKMAGCGNAVVRLVNGREVIVTELTKEALATVDNRLADMGYDELASVLPTLPKEDADLLVRL